ncbi:hypothetical protein LR48_Vigan11g059800 [Vigna angularis]|uniref:Uncharacterized protein n=1 Tax=Phaseolus angularis TaxID=3914 RepID=A0A0L9VR73_PHAAN|nr:hypothetical protein LR48_Vigan11g059800 [Vigna angularis]
MTQGPFLLPLNPKVAELLREVGNLERHQSPLRRAHRTATATTVLASESLPARHQVLYSPPIRFVVVVTKGYGFDTQFADWGSLDRNALKKREKKFLLELPYYGCCDRMNEAGAGSQGIKSSLLNCDDPVLVVMGKVVEGKQHVVSCGMLQERELNSCLPRMRMGRSKVCYS